MIWIVAIIVGGIIGYLSGYTMEVSRKWWYSLTNVLIDAIGGVLGVWFFFIVLGTLTASAGINFWLSIIWAIVGAVVLHSIVGAFMPRAEEMPGDSREYRRGVAHEYEEKKTEKKTRRHQKRK